MNEQHTDKFYIYKKNLEEKKGRK